MPSVRQELEATKTACWFRHASGAHRAGAWAERVREYAALRAVLADHAAVPASGSGSGSGSVPASASASAPASGRLAQPPIQLPGLLKLVAERAHYAGAEPVYRRYRSKQHGQPIQRWAGTDPGVKPGAAFIAEARIVSFWPYREGVIEVGDAFDMTRTEWATAYLRALATWAADNCPLAAYHPGGPPPCVSEDLAVIVGGSGSLADAPSAAAQADRLAAQADRLGAHADRLAAQAGRLAALAGDVVRCVLSDASITPLGAFNAVRDEVRSLLRPPPEELTEQVLRAVAALSDRILHAADGETVITPGQASRLRATLGGLATLLGQRAGGDEDRDEDRDEKEGRDGDA